MRVKRMDNAKNAVSTCSGEGLIVVVGVDLVARGGKRQREGEFVGRVGLMPTMGQGRWCWM